MVRVVAQGFLRRVGELLADSPGDRQAVEFRATVAPARPVGAGWGITGRDEFVLAGPAAPRVR
ncbi:hypothetical protein [Amycolatopsis sp. GA6-003]|uniref:hypothetical protein n=1 Tax=Amycolatopsis sp. GA6-003 TaxID=2652444 RepID=UPI003916FF2B